MQRRTLLLVRSDDCGWADLRISLEAMEGIRVVGEATTARRALALASTHKPDGIIAAASLAGTSTASLLSEFRSTVSLLSKLIVMAGRLDMVRLTQFAQVGVSAHLLWNDMPSPALGHLILAVVAGQILAASPDVADAYVAIRSRALRKDGRSTELTKLERAILRRLNEGMTHEEMARFEKVSRRTVDRVVSNLADKLDAPTPFMLGRQAERFGLLD